jgi:hypothetical protein
MKRVGMLVAGLLAMATLGAAAAWGGGSDQPYAGAAVLGRSGSIRGVVLCGEGEGEAEGGEATTPAPREWSTVWVQGLGFSARTDEQGRFRIDYVPPGTYTLGIQTAGMPIRGEFEVTVSSGAVSDVGELAVSGGCGQCGGEGHEGGTGGHEGGMGGYGSSSSSPGAAEPDSEFGIEGCCSAA